MRVCTKCGVAKDEAEFYRDSRSKDGLRAWCKPCHKADCAARAAADPENTNARSKRWREAHPGRASEISRTWQLRHPEQFRQSTFKGKYNVDWDALWRAQNGLCACCGSEMLPTGREKTSACVDHDRACCPGPKSCGKCVRGLIHWGCNLVLGYAKDNDTLLMAAAQYIVQWRGRSPAQ